MKPKFLDCPPRYTRTQREQTDDVGYACAIIGVKRRMDWQDKLVIVACLATVVIVGLLVLAGVVQ